MKTELFFNYVQGNNKLSITNPVDVSDLRYIVYYTMYLRSSAEMPLASLTTAIQASQPRHHFVVNVKSYSLSECVMFLKVI